ncbi:MAG: glycosyltransferase family 4 protein, partial [Rugosibacter sp.]|nr:glycosyltransferase family 4 protein [Rugosibacter sp.]
TCLGHQVFVATPRFVKLAQWQRDIKTVGGKYIYWRPYKFIERQHLAAPFRWLAQLSIPMLRYYKIELAHIALPWNFVGISLAYVLSAADIPFVMGVHCKFDSKTLPKKSLPFAKQALRSLKGVYAVSTPVKDSFLRLYQDLIPAATPIEVIHNGIDTERFQPNADARQALRERLGFAKEDFVVMFCGRLHTHKRPVFALQVFSELVKSHPQSRLLIVGDGPELAALRTQIDALQLQDKVILAGQVANTAPYYQASDCYISTSVQIEGYSLTTAEALASDIPAVVPDDEVFNSVYGASTAVQRCNPADPADWCQALLSVAQLDAPARQALGQAAQKFAQTHLSEEVMNQKLALFYENILAGLVRN